RSGGAEYLALPWLLQRQTWSQVPELESTGMGLLMALRDQLTEDGDLSRRVAYIINSRLPELPEPIQFKNTPEQFTAMIESTLAAQLGRQGGEGEFARYLMRLAREDKPERIKQRLRDIFAVAEFFSRNDRAQGGQP
ncbi:MAG: hypothetical protein P8Y45_21870, partial [Exilibacterium sp.]